MVGTSVGATDGVKVWLVLLEDCCGERATVNAEVHLLLFILYCNIFIIYYYYMLYIIYIITAVIIAFGGSEVAG